MGVESFFGLDKYRLGLEISRPQQATLLAIEIGGMLGISCYSFLIFTIIKLQ